MGVPEEPCSSFLFILETEVLDTWDSYLGCPPGESNTPTGGHHNRDQALAYNCPLDSLIKRSKLPLKTFTSADRMTASGRSFQRLTTLDVKLYFDYLHNFFF